MAGSVRDARHAGITQARDEIASTAAQVALLQGVWDGSGCSALWVNAAMLLALFGAYTALSTKVFRWE